MSLSSIETQRRVLISNLKEETMSHEEARIDISFGEREEHSIREGGDCMLVFAILSLIAYVNEYSGNHSELSKKE